MRCRGVAFARRMARPRKARNAGESGFRSKTAKPWTRREKWSSTTAIQKQNGHSCGKAPGSQGTQKPKRVGTAVRSIW